MRLGPGKAPQLVGSPNCWGQVSGLDAMKGPQSFPLTLLPLVGLALGPSPTPVPLPMARQGHTTTFHVALVVGLPTRVAGKGRGGEGTCCIQPQAPCSCPSPLGPYPSSVGASGRCHMPQPGGASRTRNSFCHLLPSGLSWGMMDGAAGPEQSHGRQGGSGHGQHWLVNGAPQAHSGTCHPTSP